MSCVYLVVPVTYGSSLPTGCESASSRDEVMCAFFSLSLGTSRVYARARAVAGRAAGGAGGRGRRAAPHRERFAVDAVWKSLKSNHGGSTCDTISA